MREFCRWRAYEGVEPFGDYRLLQQNAALIARVFNALRPKGDRALSAEEFMPAKHAGPKRQSVREMLANFKAFAVSHNARMRRKAK